MGPVVERTTVGVTVSGEVVGDDDGDGVSGEVVGVSGEVVGDNVGDVVSGERSMTRMCAPFAGGATAISLSNAIA